MLRLSVRGRHPASIADLRQRAARRIPKIIFDYLDGGAGAEMCLTENRRALDSVKLAPRFLCTETLPIEGGTTVFGEYYAIPLGVSPVGLAGFIWPGAELAAARLAAEFRIPFVLSIVGTASMEEIFQAAQSRAWLQVYPTNDEAILADIMSRAESIGYKVLVVTVDSPVSARRQRDIRNGFGNPFVLSPRTIWQFATRPRWLFQIALEGVPECAIFRPYLPRTARTPFERIAFAEAQVKNAACTLKELKRIRDLWPATLVVKGILSEKDAEIALESGADGLIISNHGGRQLEAAPASVDILMQLADRFGSRCTLMLDSGIRSGLDVVRGLAVGARLCFSGRTFYYAAGAGGQDKLRLALELLIEEYNRNLGQLGCSPKEAWIRKVS
jgi:L-lactate dehydrogenase (cytochrome)